MRATGAVTTHHNFAAPMDALELADGRLIALEAAKGAITLIGGSVEDNALIRATAGNVSLEATTGNLAALVSEREEEGE